MTGHEGQRIDGSPGLDLGPGGPLKTGHLHVARPHVVQKPWAVHGLEAIHEDTDALGIHGIRVDERPQWAVLRGSPQQLTHDQRA